MIRKVFPSIFSNFYFLIMTTNTFNSFLLAKVLISKTHLIKRYEHFNQKTFLFNIFILGCEGNKAEN